LDRRKVLLGELAELGFGVARIDPHIPANERFLLFTISALLLCPSCHMWARATVSQRLLSDVKNFHQIVDCMGQFR